MFQEKHIAQCLTVKRCIMHLQDNTVRTKWLHLCCNLYDSAPEAHTNHLYYASLF